MAKQNHRCDLSNLTRFERQLKCFQSHQCKGFNLNEAVKKRMQDSTLGSFLYHLNATQLQQNFIQQDKLDRIEFDIGKDLYDVNDMERCNDICENVFELINICLRESPTGKMTVKNVLKRMKLLRMTGSKVRNMDDTLYRLKDLEALVLAGNCLTSCPGGSLPRSLMVLELCCNTLDDLSSLSDNPPPHLVYLGLARNNLTSGVAQFLNKFKFLYHLDLSQNNIEDLSDMVIACAQLQCLSSLLLIGNPCSMSPNYMKFILNKMPKLIFLDEEMLKQPPEGEEKNYEQLDHNMQGILQIHVFRIMGIPQPSNEKINNKKVTHSYRIELESPILQSLEMKRENSFIIDESLLKNEEDNKKSANGNLKKKKTEYDKANEKKKKSSGHIQVREKSESPAGIKDKDKKKLSGDASSKDRKKLSLGKKGRESSKDVKQEDYLTETISKEENEVDIYELELTSDQEYSQACFKSEKKTWGKIVDFKDPAIEVPFCNLRPLRDLFRTELVLRIVYLKTLPPASKAKSKPKKKKSNQSEELQTADDDSNKWFLVSKSTIAKITVPLQDIKWSTQYLEYAWNNSKPYNVELTTGLKNLQYVAGKNKQPKGNKDGVKSGGIVVPTVLTCHVGVGVKRNEQHSDTRLN